MNAHSEVQRLVQEAAGLPEDVHYLAGREGYHASLETSSEGRARKISVSRDGIEVCWTFSLETDEARPSFYPDEVPFLGDLPAVLMWTEESGLSVKWLAPSFQDRIRELVSRVRQQDRASIPREVTQVAEQMIDATREEKEALLARFDVERGGPLGEWAINLFGEPAEVGLPEHAAEGLRRILEFHEESGWALTGRESGAVQQRYEMTRGQSERRLFAMSVLGLTTINLNERP